MLYNGDSKLREIGGSCFGEGEDHVCLSGMRICFPQMDGALSRLWFLEYHGRRAGNRRPRTGRYKGPAQVPVGYTHHPGGAAPGRSDGYGNPGIEPGPRRRPGSGLPDPGGRGSRDRQIHPAAAGLSPFGRPRLLGPVRFRGGVSGTAAAAGGSVEGFGRPPVCRGGDGSFGDRFADRNDSPPDAGDRFDSDRLSPGDHFGPRQRRPGAGVYGASDAFGQGAGNHRNHRRPRDQSGGDRRPSAAGAHGGLRPLFRRGPAPRLPDPPGGEKTGSAPPTRWACSK